MANAFASRISLVEDATGVHLVTSASVLKVASLVIAISLVPLRICVMRERVNVRVFLTSLVGSVTNVYRDTLDFRIVSLANATDTRALAMIARENAMIAPVTLRDLIVRCAKLDFMGILNWGRASHVDRVSVLEEKIPINISRQDAL